MSESFVRVGATVYIFTASRTIMSESTHRTPKRQKLFDDYTYSVEIRSGDKPRLACEGIIHLTLLSGDNSIGKETVLEALDFPEDFKRGHTHTFTLKGPKISNITGVRIRGDHSVGYTGWKIDTITIATDEDLRRKIVIPVFSSITSGNTYDFPVDDIVVPSRLVKYSGQKDRELRAKADEYKLTINKLNGEPPLVESLPRSEKFSFTYKLSIEARAAELTLAAKAKEFLHHDEFSSIEDIKSVYHWNLGMFPAPENMDRWNNDELFGLQRLAGTNCRKIKLCKRIPENMAIKKNRVETFLEGKTLQQALTEERLYEIDYKILEGTPTKPGFILPSPIALFFQRNDKKLLPICIQLFQKPSATNPVFYPDSDRNVWMLAKMWFNLADANYHQAVAHLGFTHLKMEGVVACTHQQLSKTHPIYKLLMPHFTYLLAINDLGFSTLIEKGGFFDRVMSTGSEGMQTLVKKVNEEWRLNVEGSLPDDLAERGVYNSDLLPHYYYREDGMKLHVAIKNYVKKYVDLYYKADADVRDDHEINAWRTQLGAPFNKQGLAMKGVFGHENGFACKEELISTLTCFIYICSAEHAAVNFRQYEEYAFPPNYPSQLRGSPPRCECPMTEADLLHALPNRTGTFDIMIITKILSQRSMNKLGDFDIPYITDANALKIVKEFQDALSAITDEIRGANETRLVRYECLRPDLVPNSISI